MSMNMARGLLLGKFAADAAKLKSQSARTRVAVIVGALGGTMPAAVLGKAIADREAKSERRDAAAREAGDKNEESPPEGRTGGGDEADTRQRMAPPQDLVATRTRLRGPGGKFVPLDHDAPPAEE